MVSTDITQIFHRLDDSRHAGRLFASRVQCLTDSYLLRKIIISENAPQWHGYIQFQFHFLQLILLKWPKSDCFTADSPLFCHRGALDKLTNHLFRMPKHYCFSLVKIQRLFCFFRSPDYSGHARINAIAAFLITSAKSFRKDVPFRYWSKCSQISIGCFLFSSLSKYFKVVENQTDSLSFSLIVC